MKYSIIVPVYNRPDEARELLESLCNQTESEGEYEVIIVEDGSQKPCKEVCDEYASRLPLRYFAKENSGPGQSRNYGAERATGDWLIVLDSDVVLPPGYLKAVGEGLRLHHTLAAFGGPDAAHESFTPTQKAISYSMTSFFTTGGIRGGASPIGGKKGGALDKFYPRSYNMGVRRDVYLALGGFSKMRFGEDIDFSYRIVEAGNETALLPEAWVWHKRRTDFRKFFRQVYNSGIARINLSKRHPGTMKLVHLLPAVFTVGVIALILASAVGRALMHYDPGHDWSWLFLLPWVPLLAYSLLIITDATIRSKSLTVGLLAVPASFTQLCGYGLGFIEAWWKRCIKGQDEFQAFEKTFYK